MATTLPANQRPLTPQELLQAKELFERDMQVLLDSAEQLKDAHERFAQNIGSLQLLGEAKEGQQVMVPLTPSVSVLGSIKEPKRVTVDIGTGYFVEMDSEDASGYYERKAKFIQEQLIQIEKLSVEKRNQLGMIHQALSHYAKASK